MTLVKTAGKSAEHVPKEKDVSPTCVNLLLVPSGIFANISLKGNLCPKKIKEDEKD